MISNMEARVLRKIKSVQSDGMVSVSGEERAVFQEMLATPMLSVAITVAGYEALRDYDLGNSESNARQRIAVGMASAGRRALSDQQNGGSDG